MNRDYIWLKISLFLNKDDMQHFFRNALLPFMNLIKNDFVNVVCVYNALSSIQGNHFRISILLHQSDKERLKSVSNNFFDPHFLVLSKDTLQTSFEIETSQLWQNFNVNSLQDDTFYLKLESKYPNIFNVFSRYTILNKVTETLNAFLLESENIEFSRLMEANILMYYYLYNTRRITLELLEDHIALLEDRYNLFTEDVYVTLIKVLDKDVENNSDFLFECNEFCRATEPFKLEWLNKFADTISIIETSSSGHNQVKATISEYTLLMINAFGLSPLKEIYSLQLLKRHLVTHQISQLI